MAANKDVTRQIEALESRIEQLNAERKAFMQIISHELRSPISSIIGFADLLEKDLEGDEDLKSFATRIVRAGWQLSHMLTRITEVEDFDNDDREPIIQPQDIAASLRALCEENQPLFDRKNIALIVEIGQGDYVFRCDKQDFDRVVNNLLSNAAKFSPKGTRAHVKLSSSDNHIRLTVSDEGPGFKKEEPLLFQKFTKLSAKPTNRETSTGLGLYVVKKCLDRMGASIRIETACPRGALVEVTFPV